MRLVLAIGLLACSPSSQIVGDDVAVFPDAGGVVVSPPVFTGDAGDVSEVYAHSGTTLYRIDTTTFTPVAVGAMSGLGSQSLANLAIDKHGVTVGITADKIYDVSQSDGSVSLVRALTGSATGLTSLSYIPSNLEDDTTDDILVSANAQGDVLQIDTVTGTATVLGNYGSNALGKITSSGDLIGVRKLGIFATVNYGSGSNDYLASIDPTTWLATPLPNDTGFDNVFGLAFWGGTILGFVDDKTDHTGTIISIDPNSGIGTVVNTGSIEWAGAAVTTDAPVIPAF